MSKNQVELVLKHWHYRSRPDSLQIIDSQLELFKADPQSCTDVKWIPILRRALGLSHRTLAEKLDISPSGVLQLEHREEAGNVTLNTLREYASAIDCELVYAIVPKRHKTFAGLLVEKFLPFVSKEKLLGGNSDQRAWAIAMITRAQGFLGHKTGWLKIWGSKRALQNKAYNWHVSRRRWQ